ncbi:MAG: hypothetical protein FD177_2717 [Desulfovibrionaceae bacterium]|nr:MAG: hypothetical protein FD177_2717 [Desulfovibrionaceae bacterium]
MDYYYITTGLIEYTKLLERWPGLTAAELDHLVKERPPFFQMNLDDPCPWDEPEDEEGVFPRGYIVVKKRIDQEDGEFKYFCWTMCTPMQVYPFEWNSVDATEYAFRKNDILKWETGKDWLFYKKPNVVAEQGPSNVDPRARITLQKLLAAAICRGSEVSMLSERSLVGKLVQWTSSLGLEVSDDTVRRVIKDMKKNLKIH